MRTRLLLLLILLAAGCRGDRPSPPPPADETETRLVVLSPAASVILQDVGAGHLVVGRHDFDDSLPDLPATGHQGGIDYETLLSLRPTHVLIEWGDRALPDRLVTLAGRNAWSIEPIQLDTLDQIVETTDRLQRAFGDAEAGPVSARLQESWSPSDKPLGSLGRVLLLGSVAPPSALGTGSFHDEILRRLGATPAIRDGGPWMELDSEDIIALDPDAVILVDPSPAGSGIGAVGPEALEKLGVVASLDIAAVRTGRVAVLDGLHYQKPSTAMGDFARDLRGVLDGWAGEGP